MYHTLYLAAKGNTYKNKNVLIEAIHKSKAETIRQAELDAQRQARRDKNAVRKEKRVARKAAAMGGEETPVQKVVVEEPVKVEAAKKAAKPTKK